MASSRHNDYADLLEFLTKHNAKDKATEITHTRIPDKELSIYGGSYAIPKEGLETFYKLYYDHVFVKRRKEYLTEKQLIDGTGPLLVDFDFRFDYKVEKRLHSKDHIVDMILVYLEELKSLLVFHEDVPFDIFIFEKPNVNRLMDKSVTKDGIHMLIGIQMDHTLQTILRERMIVKLKDILVLPFINTWDKILDEGISKGTTNWQLYGSRKPGNESYEMTYHYIVSFDKSDNEFMMDEKKPSDFDFKKNFQRLSCQYDQNPKFAIHPKIKDEHERLAGNKNLKPKRAGSRAKVNLLLDNEDDEEISIFDIKNKEMLQKAVDNLLATLTPMEYHVKEAHEYTQILPSKYYEPGSHLLNRQVAFALKHTDERLFLSWVMLRSKASDFDFSSIPSLFHDWKKYFNISKEGVTKRSIMYWAKQDAPEDYIKVKNTTIDHYIEQAVVNSNDYGLALVLKQMYKDKYVCVSLSKADSAWYVFKNHRWQPDKGLSLRNAISEEMYNILCKKREFVLGDYTQYHSGEGKKEGLNEKSSIMLQIMNRLRNTTEKNKIMREAAELFFDEDFIANMDTNKHLLCFNNGVVDFKNKVFREGYPSDYITKCTEINYVPLNPKDKDMMKTQEEVVKFMHQLFPIIEQHNYMWDHLASVLIGTNRNQTFNIYHGSGSNGKSLLVNLMSKVLGQYKGIVPINLLTDKRVAIGGTCDEIIKLRGVRYAVAQELTKGMKLNEGIMKELSGGDEIQARGLYVESEKFTPQFKLVVCTNNLFDIDSNDDGTWRRIRKVVYYSKFVDEEKMADYSDLPYVFPKDTTLEEKINYFAPVFAAMLVKRAFETDGVVTDCKIVLDDSNSYRNGQDHIAAFIKEFVRKTGDNKTFLQKTPLWEKFKTWFQSEHGTRKMPKGTELNEYMDKKFGPYRTKGWQGVTLFTPEEIDDEE
jgi:P4 family phage/plasmid primase-like protien